MPTYIALVHKDADSDYGVSFPDLPGCVSAGLDLDEALAMAGQALALHLAGMAEDGEAVPQPSSLQSVMSDPARHEAVALLVEARDPGAVDVRLRLGEDDLRVIDAEAEHLGKTRSQILIEAAKDAIRRRGAA